MTTTPAPWLSTARIALREFVPSDFDDLYRLDSDARVMRYLNGGQPLTHAEVRDALVRVLHGYPHYHGLGVWRAHHCPTGAFIGWFALKYCPPTCDVEVGYRLVPEFWNQGLATEGTRALLAHAFDALGLFRVIGITHPDNMASQRVLLKSGLVDEGWGHYYDRRVRLFAAARAQPSGRRGHEAMVDSKRDLAIGAGADRRIRADGARPRPQSRMAHRTWR
ncbi:MAG TPA: GNAT family N-acetyltransferase [Casimicrobiaceae bacterium]|nr:GNAT family N-acetyltransferase [Casimicrobiaceae bacterium]